MKLRARTSPKSTVAGRPDDVVSSSTFKKDSQGLDSPTDIDIICGKEGVSNQYSTDPSMKTISNFTCLTSEILFPSTEIRIQLSHMFISIQLQLHRERRRFLIYDNESGRWVQLSSDQIRKKIAQSFRDRLPLRNPKRIGKKRRQRLLETGALALLPNYNESCDGQSQTRRRGRSERKRKAPIAARRRVVRAKRKSRVRSPVYSTPTTGQTIDGTVSTPSVVTPEKSKYTTTNLSVPLPNLSLGNSSASLIPKIQPMLNPSFVSFEPFMMRKFKEENDNADQETSSATTPDLDDSLDTEPLKLFRDVCGGDRDVGYDEEEEEEEDELMDEAETKDDSDLNTLFDILDSKCSGWYRQPLDGEGKHPVGDSTVFE